MSGFPAKTSSPSKKFANWWTCFPSSASTRFDSPGANPCSAKTCQRWCRCWRITPRLHDLAMTTNGILLTEHAQALYDAGLHRVTISLDTLRPDRFKRLTRRDSPQGPAGHPGRGAGWFPGLKLDTVVIRGTNEDELVDLIEYGKRVEAEVRFIEYMDVGGATQWSMDKVVSRADILAHLEHHYGTISAIRELSSAPAERFRLPDGTAFGIIASTTTPFCRTCDRSRLTADGMWYLCLYAQKGIDLRTPLRAGASRDDIRALIASTWQHRYDRGAEQRQELRFRGCWSRSRGCGKTRTLKCTPEEDRRRGASPS